MTNRNPRPRPVWSDDLKTGPVYVRDDGWGVISRYEAEYRGLLLSVYELRQHDRACPNEFTWDVGTTAKGDLLGYSVEHAERPCGTLQVAKRLAVNAADEHLAMST